jgi:spore maturation protein CgeB
MMRSKIIISPFGFGEICFRDFEAVCCGCLLVKPRMDHVRTKPDIFLPEETYVPIAWDCSDLAEKTAWYLSHPANAQRIAATARERLVEYYRSAGYAQDIAAAFEGL